MGPRAMLTAEDVDGRGRRSLCCAMPATDPRFALRNSFLFKLAHAAIVIAGFTGNYHRLDVGPCLTYNVF